VRRGTTDEQTPTSKLRITSIGPAFFAVTLSALAVVILRETPWPWDPIYYVQTAQAYATPSSIPLEHRALRWGMLIPLHTLQTLLGNTEVGYYAFPIIAVALLALSVFVLSRRVMRPWWASAAALVATTNPIVLSRSSHPFPDVIATALLTLGLAALLWLDKIDPARKGLVAVGAGLCFGCAYAAREAVIVLAPVVLAVLIITAVPPRYAAATLVGSLSVLGLEFVLMNEWFGNPLARIEVLLERNTRTNGPTFPPERIAQTEAFQGSLSQSLTAWFRRWNMVGHFGLAPVIGGVGTALLAWRSGSESKRFWRTMLAWIVIGWIVFIPLGIWRNNRGGFVFNLLQIRYWYVLVPPIALGAVGALQWLSKREFGMRSMDEPVQLHRLTIVAAAGLCFLLFVASLGQGFQTVGGFSEMHEFREWLAHRGGEFDTIAASPESGSVASIYTSGSFGAEIWDGEILQIGSKQAPDLYLVSWHETDAESLVRETDEIDLWRPPAAWKIEFVAPSGKLALLTPNDSDRKVTTGPIFGPELPVDIQFHHPTGHLWVFSEVGSTPLQFRIGFTGAQPYVVCLGQSAMGEAFAVPAAYLNIELNFAQQEEHFNAFCPASHGLSGIRISTDKPPNSTVTSVFMLAETGIEYLRATRSGAQ
jgi:hypothetical protein